MTEQCSFGKRTTLPHLRHTASALCQFVKSPGLPLPLCGPVLLSSVAQGDHSALQRCNFWSTISQGGFCPAIKWAGAGLCDYIAGGPILSPLQAQPMLCSGREKSAHYCCHNTGFCWPGSLSPTPFYRLVSTSPNRRLWICILKSQWLHPAELSSTGRKGLLL